MKLVNADNPVRSSWLAEQGFRLDPSPFLSGAYEAKKLLERLPRTQPLSQVTQPDGIFHPGRFSRRWVTDPEHGIPFFSSTDILEADFSYLPLIAKSAAKENPRLRIQPGWTLITRSGTVGRIAYARPDVRDFACSEHVLRVVPDRTKIPSGYLFAYLGSRYGLPIITSAAYGAIIQHIEPHHIAGLPVPRFDADIENQIHQLIEQAAELRASFQAGVREATRDLFTSAGLPELVDYSWHKQPRATGFAALPVRPTSLRASNYDARAKFLTERISSVESIRLGDICAGGKLASGVRFKRIDSLPEAGAVLLVGQKDGFWSRPEGRWISADQSPSGIFANNETIMVASQGLPGESSLICRAMMVTGSWLKFAYTQHFLRVEPGKESISGAYLFAFLRSEPAFRMLRSMLQGTGPQDIHPILRREIPVPLCTPEDRERIAETVRQAYRDRDEADRREDQALTLLDQAVREAAG
ncbi:methylation-associated defense system restriction endonuclease subunit S MAD5 [Micromonospora marina]|uniref:methylation-associated defense system restriction endonuclease subunit S MAD5 n=1 Tax=Micromonospora marina TaxID=307120 RepID=UPI003D74B919